MKLAHHHVVDPPPVASSRSRWRASGGAALVELAFVALLLTTLSGGAFDFGMAYRAALSTNEAARAAARTGSALANNPLADYYALSGAKATLTNTGRINDVQKVVVFKSTTVDGAVPTTCATQTTSTEKCVVLTGDQFRGLTQSGFDSTTGCFTAATIKTWCPSSRNNVQLTADYYGIWIQMKYTHLFKFLRTSTTIERDAVMRLEPSAS